jgi:hypothetical protein
MTELATPDTIVQLRPLAPAAASFATPPARPPRR